MTEALEKSHPALRYRVIATILLSLAGAALTTALGAAFAGVWTSALVSVLLWGVFAARKCRQLALREELFDALRQSVREDKAGQRLLSELEARRDERS